ncbi:phage antirepressor protein [Liquorilactobacillus sucicola DSM 21376 = JCM 15457]|uniref:Antirepressor n=1 Tax=Liquorilactobacillus sucicola DSM 21376 = JCM 15457 TaxID=1423806 RepID=A0A023D0E5_9LACO|nr:antirepressor [Liquorilactobacillus sucicola DSM 21376 = JCM 15457]GAJ27539.1 phage antirepressor protein [Liquorilactobacillus sucicola DSM 21376 = JCM 15457]
MNDLMNFDFKGNQVRTVKINDEPYFVGKDVAEILGYKNPQKALRDHVDDEDKTSALIQGSGSNYKSKTILINESGLYSLILSSKQPQAKEFKRWVTHEVLPSIRKHGAYMTDQKAEQIFFKLFPKIY